MAQNDVISKVVEILEKIVDPEIGIDVYNLGLIYSIEVLGGNRIKIKMTLTTPFCPLAYYLPTMVVEEIKNKLGYEVDVELVYDPPWTPERMTEKGRRMFKERFGYDIVEMYRRYSGGGNV